MDSEMLNFSVATATITNAENQTVDFRESTSNDFSFQEFGNVNSNWYLDMDQADSDNAVNPFTFWYQTGQHVELTTPNNNMFHHPLNTLDTNNAHESQVILDLSKKKENVDLQNHLPSQISISPDLNTPALDSDNYYLQRNYISSVANEIDNDLSINNSNFQNSYIVSKEILESRTSSLNEKSLSAELNHSISAESNSIHKTNTDITDSSDKTSTNRTRKKSKAVNQDEESSENNLKTSAVGSPCKKCRLNCAKYVSFETRNIINRKFWNLNWI